jgi:hypothetical protein
MVIPSVTDLFKARMAKRPKQIPPRPPLTQAQIGVATYVGSAEHKEYRWWGGLHNAYVGEQGTATRPKKQDTTICPLIHVADRTLATTWVRAALHANQLRYYEADQAFPKKVWYRDLKGQIWFGLCTNTTLGQYKGWPIDEEERDAVFG